jgi:hypothetical protein
MRGYIGLMQRHMDNHRRLFVMGPLMGHNRYDFHH